MFLQENCVHTELDDEYDNFIEVHLEAAHQKWSISANADVEQSCCLLALRLRNCIVWRFRLRCQFCNLFLENFCRVAETVDVLRFRIWHFEIFFTNPQSACVADADVSTFARLIGVMSRRFHQYSVLVMNLAPGSAYERLTLHICTHPQITDCIPRMVLDVSLSSSKIKKNTFVFTLCIIYYADLFDIRLGAVQKLRNTAWALA